MVPFLQLLHVPILDGLLHRVIMVYFIHSVVTLTFVKNYLRDERWPTRIPWRLYSFDRKRQGRRRHRPRQRHCARRASGSMSLPVKRKDCSGSQRHRTRDTYCPGQRQTSIGRPSVTSASFQLEARGEPALC